MKEEYFFCSKGNRNFIEVEEQHSNTSWNDGEIPLISYDLLQRIEEPKKTLEHLNHLDSLWSSD